ncbi:MAG TPA: PilZ domain-containing protein [Bryobacteraceae bacterium]|nr:PilZ domain-containing protein [Bryobacteraceae bacterium]
MACATAEFAIPVQLHFRDGLREEVKAEIARVNTGFLLLRSTTGLDPARNVELVYLERRIACETVYSHPQADGTHRVGLRMLDGANGALRVERRIRLDASAVLNTSVLPGPTPVRVIDVSSSGMGVRLVAPIKVGDLAYVEMEHGVAFGEIRHCAKIEDGYRAGLFVEEFISRVPGAANPWTAQRVEVPRRSATLNVTSAIKTALFGSRRT